MAKGEEKTNVMRILDKEKVDYAYHTYDHDDGLIDGISIANKMGKPLETVYKTLVTKGKSSHFVFVVPVACELDLKKAARSVGEKAVEMIKVADINKVTGYIRGGCSPIGMKKAFVTVYDKSAETLPTITVSAGRIGSQIELSPQVLAKLTRGTFEDIIK
ncbi:MAG: Cys-tRNA(Pro) deacylase [Clostridia bacterium]|nr:Cys-tRNA(Pro) deacylase [Clostridia bacterium]MBR3869975.1 Cys-tRNA(Pro) deacylase [Clostridia bacterium]